MKEKSYSFGAALKPALCVHILNAIKLLSTYGNLPKHPMIKSHAQDLQTDGNVFLSTFILILVFS